MVVGCWLLVVGCWLLVVGSWFLVVGCWLLVVGCWLLVVGCWLLVVGCWLLVFGFGFLVVGCWLLVVGCWLLVLGYWFLVLGCWFLVLVVEHEKKQCSDVMSCEDAPGHTMTYHDMPWLTKPCHEMTCHVSLRPIGLPAVNPFHFLLMSTHRCLGLRQLPLASRQDRGCHTSPDGRQGGRT